MDVRNDWEKPEIHDLYNLPFNDLLYLAQQTHRCHFNPNLMQTSQLLNIKTGACPEDCAYCPQSRYYKTELKKEPFFKLERVLEEAKKAKENGASRFCLGAAWRRPPKMAIPKLIKMIQAIKALGLETCITVGTLNQEQAQAFKEGGLDFYNHNLDTSAEYYPKIISTRPYQERLETLHHVRTAGLKVCCGGIIGLGETREDRVGLLWQLATMPKHPESVPINLLMTAKGTPLANMPPLDPLELVRTIAVARILMPQSVIRLTAGRTKTSNETQALCFLAGANSIFYGDKLLTTPNPNLNQDKQLLDQLGIKPIAISNETTCLSAQTKYYIEKENCETCTD